MNIYYILLFIIFCDTKCYKLFRFSCLTNAEKSLLSTYKADFCNNLRFPCSEWISVSTLLCCSLSNEKKREIASVMPKKSTCYSLNYCYSVGLSP